MHAMLGNVGDGYRRKRPGAYVQRDERARNTSTCERIEGGIVEMQAGGWCGHGAGVARINGLVAVGVRGVRRVMDVWRERQLAVALEPRVERARALETNAVQPVEARFDDRLCARCELDRRADSRRVACAYLNAGCVGTIDSFDQDFHIAARWLASSQACVDDARVVEHEQVTGIEAIRKIDEAQVRQPIAIDVQQPAAGAIDGRAL